MRRPPLGAGLAEVVPPRAAHTSADAAWPAPVWRPPRSSLGVGLTATHWLPDRAAPAPGGGLAGHRTDPGATAT
ncbi:MAG: hypothetical protein IPO89_13695 [Actinomycetales bacterium]|nr:hypothetical protein [Candidatus Lutibacillus vidarii]